MVHGKHAKVGRAQTAGSAGHAAHVAGAAHASAPERRMVTAIGYPLAFAALCALAIGPGYAVAADAANNASGGSAGADDAAVVSNQTSNAAAASSKDETVYAFSKADGTLKNVEVSAKLANPGGATELADASTLSNIENVEGSETFRGAGQDMVWDAQGNDIYYRGDSDAELPIDVAVTYRLDGNAISPDELAGKSGDVSMHYSFTNKTEAADGVKVPFLAVTGMVLDNEKITEVEIDNGRVIDDGDRTVVIGYAMPGLADSLGISSDDLDIPGGFTITAKATDFKLSSALTFVTCDLFDSDSFDDVDTSDLDGASDQLKDAMSQLIEGAGKLSDGLGQLSDGAGTAKDASGKLADGAQTLADGNSELASGVNTMKDQSAALPSGVNQLATGASALSEGLPAAVDAAGQLASGASDLSSGLGDAVDGVDRLIAGTDQLSGGLSQLTNEMGAITTGANQLESSLSDAKGQMVTAAGGQDKVVDGIDSAKKSMEDAIKAVEALKTSNHLEDRDVANIMTALNGGIATAQGTLPVASAVKDGLDAAVESGGDFDKAIAGAKQLSEGNKKVVNAIEGQIMGGVSDLRSGLEKLKGDDGLQAAIDGSAKLAAGATQLKGDEKSGLTYAANGAKQLSTGLDQLRDKIPALISGVSQIATGSDKLKDGSATLANSLKKFDSALEGLADGAKSAAEGSSSLTEGLQTFNDEGISKITELLDSDLVKASDKLDSVRDAGQSYTNFSGITPDTPGSVKFVFELDAIE